MRRRNILILGIIVILIFFLLPLMFFCGPATLRDYVHKELVYKVLTSKLTDRNAADKQNALKLFYYVHTHLFVPKNSDVVDKHPLNDLIRGIAYCDQQSNALITLARKNKIRGRLIFLRGFSEVSHHSICELYLDGKYRVFDPFLGYVFLTKGGDIATFSDIQNGNTIYSEQLNATLFLNKDFDASDYFKLYEPKYDFIVFINNFNRDLKRESISKIMDLYYEIFDGCFLLLFQEIYFKLADVDIFTKARLKHLSFRFKSAIIDYTKIINSNSDDFVRSESLFFRGQALWDMQDYEECISTFEELMDKFPENRWEKAVYFYLGSSYENIGEFDKAKFYYSKVKNDSTTPAPTRLMKLMELESVK